MSTSDRPQLAVAGALAFIIITSGGGPARAQQNEEARVAADLARQRAIEAEQLYGERDFRGALQKLDEAFAIYPSPKIHFNFGLVRRALVQNVESLEAFERFLAEAPDADAERRTVAARHAAELRAVVTTLEIRSDTEGAEVFVDGRPCGTTPLARPVRVAPGHHQVIVQKSGVPFPYAERIEAVAGGLVRIEARLAPIVEALRARVVPASPAARGPGLDLQLGQAGAAAEPPRFYRRWWFWAAVGTAVTTAVVTSVILARRRDQRSVCDNLCSLGEIPVDAR